MSDCSLPPTLGSWPRVWACSHFLRLAGEGALPVPLPFLSDLCRVSLGAVFYGLTLGISARLQGRVS